MKLLSKRFIAFTLAIMLILGTGMLSIAEGLVLPEILEEDKVIDLIDLKQFDLEEKDEIELIDLEEVDIEEIQEPTNVFEISPMAISTPGYYEVDEDGVLMPAVVEGQSTNSHTMPSYLWLKDGIIHVAVKSTHPLSYMDLSGAISYVTNPAGITTPQADEYNPWVQVFVDDIELNLGGLTGNTDASHWTIFKFNLEDVTLVAPLPFFVKGQGGGHDVDGNLIVDIDIEIDVTGNKVWLGGDDNNRPAIRLQLMRQIDQGEKELVATVDLNGLDDDWTYTWEGMEKYNTLGQEYIYSVDEETVPVGYKKTLDGLTVTNEKTGTISITKEVLGPIGNLSSTDFHIKISGPNAYEEIVTLKAGETISLVDLDLGRYTVEEINIDNNFRLISITPEDFTLTLTGSHADVVVVNALNYHKFGIFKVGAGTSLGLADAEFVLKQGEVVVGTYTTDEFGHVLLEGLLPGQYTLQETIAPIGYKLDNTIYTITIGTDGSIAIDPQVEILLDGDYPIIKIENILGPRLPDTGGIGTLIFTVIGMGLMIGAYVYYRKKQA